MDFVFCAVPEGLGFLASPTHRWSGGLSSSVPLRGTGHP